MEKNWNLPGTFHLQSDLIDFYVYFRYNTDEITNHEGKQSMNQKELSELRRRWRLDKNAVSRIYGCFVNSAKEIVADLNESLGMLPQEEAEKYLSLLKKAMSGTMGKNLIDISFTTQQVMDSEEHRLLMKPLILFILIYLFSQIFIKITTFIKCGHLKILEIACNCLKS